MTRKRTRSTVADHPKRAEIEAALARAIPLRKISERFGPSIDALCRHRKRMRRDQPQVFQALAAANWKVKPEDLEAFRLETSDAWLVLLRSQYDKLVAAQDQCLQSGNYSIGSQVSAQLLKCLDMLGRAVGEISQHSVRVQNNVVISPVYWRVRTAIVQALRDHPEARQAVLRALQGAEAGGEGSAPLLELTAERKPGAADYRVEAIHAA